MTALAQGRAMPCDHPRCDKPATVEVDAWSYCTEHAGNPHPPAASQTRRPVTTITGAPAPSQPPITLSAPPSPIGLLLEHASGHSSKRIRTLADRIEAQLDQLRDLIKSHEKDEEAKQAEKAAREHAKAEVERLTAQLAAAKAALRKAPATDTPAPAGRLVCGNGCGRTFTRPHWLSKHENTCRQS